MRMTNQSWKRMCSVLPSQKSEKKTKGKRRAVAALNCMGKRIWANKPRLFNGSIWHLRVSTIERSIAFVARRNDWMSIEVPF